MDSGLQQTLSNWECILVDDGSPDQSGAICDEYAAKDSRFRVIHKLNGGVSSARNEGLDTAKGEFICFIDSDDWVGPKYLEHLFTAMGKDNSDLVIAGNERISIAESKKCFKYEDDFLTHDRYSDIFLKHHLQKHGSPWAKLFKTKLIGNLKFNTDIHLGEDIIFLYYYILNTKSISFISSSDYYYVFQFGSLTQRLNPYESEWKGWQEFHKVSNLLRVRMVGEEAYLHNNNNNTVFVERVINAIYHDFPDSDSRVERLKLIDWDLYKKCKVSHTWKEQILKFLLVHKCFIIYDILVTHIHKR